MSEQNPPPPPSDPFNPAKPGGKQAQTPGSPAAPATPAGTFTPLPPGTAAGADAAIAGSETFGTTTDPTTSILNDPTVAAILNAIGASTKTTQRQSAFQRLEAQYFDAYVKLWGTIPPPGYVQSAIHSGINLIEFTDNEMQKPAFARTVGYRDQAATMAGALAQALGTRG